MVNEKAKKKELPFFHDRDAFKFADELTGQAIARSRYFRHEDNKLPKEQEQFIRRALKLTADLSYGEPVEKDQWSTLQKLAREFEAKY